MLTRARVAALATSLARDTVKENEELCTVAPSGGGRGPESR